MNEKGVKMQEKNVQGKKKQEKKAVRPATPVLIMKKNEWTFYLRSWTMKMTLR